MPNKPNKLFDNLIKKLKEITDFVPVEEPSHRHVRKDMDLL